MTFVCTGPGLAFTSWSFVKYRHLPHPKHDCWTHFSFCASTFQRAMDNKVSNKFFKSSFQISESGQLLSHFNYLFYLYQPVAASRLQGKLLMATMQNQESGPGKSASRRMGSTFAEGPSFPRTGCCPPLTASLSKRHSCLSTFALFWSSANIHVNVNH